ncbi:MAG: hypothetical protein LCH63_17000 [Candidatus Melainabacteria bacterium]|jgi:hypothetical protein|nr:hypothetical protein [Candidatus Melainabacteria bacterium]
MQTIKREPRVPSALYSWSTLLAFVVIGVYSALDVQSRTNLLDASVKTIETVAAFFWAGLLGALLTVFALLFLDMTMRDTVRLLRK